MAATSKLQIVLDVLMPPGAKKTLGDVNKSVDALGKQESKLSKLGVSFGQLAGAIGIVGGAALTAKKAFDFASEGAELDLLASQFANVAENAGMAADTLLNDLRAATHGMVSDADLMQSGLDIISLGLADTQEGVVDLATVISTLGLDMQQVIMTLSNNSVQRLDALGLSVQAVTERARELNAEGFDGDAFDQAVIEGLQERMAVLGDTWETGAGQVKQMQAAITNFWDTLKRRAGDSELLSKTAEIIRQAADTATLLVTADEQITQAVQEQEQAIISNTASYEEYRDAKLSLLVVTGDLTQDEADLIRQWQAGSIALDDLRQHAGSMASALGILSREQYAAKAEFADKQAILAARDAYRKAAQAVNETGSALQQATATLREWTTAQLGQQAVSDIQAAWKNGQLTAQEYRSALMEVGTQLLGLDDSQVEASLAVAAISDAFAQGKISAQEYVDQIQRLDDLLRNLPANTTTSITVKVNQQGGVSVGTLHATPTGAATGTSKGGHQGFAQGTPPGGFVVPPGYPNDNYPVWVSSGERVIVEPPGKQSGPAQAVNYHINAPVTVYGNADSGQIEMSARRGVLDALRAAGAA